MNTIINAAMRVLGLGKAVDAIGGETSKAYLGGLGQILTGGASVLLAVANIVLQLQGAHGAGDLVSVGQALLHGDPRVLAIGAGIGLISKGLADIGNRHATAEVANAIAAQPIAPTGDATAAPEKSPAQ
jgi:hypothetical protein